MKWEIRHVQIIASRDFNIIIKIRSRHGFCIIRKLTKNQYDRSNFKHMSNLMPMIF